MYVISCLFIGLEMCEDRDIVKSVIHLDIGKNFALI